MKILVLNSGSSSIKCALYNFETLPNQLIEPIFETKIEWENISNIGSKELRNCLGSLVSKYEIDCICHRVVHGGNKYKKSVLIDDQVKEDIGELADLAPLHNLIDLEGIEILEKLLPGKPQIAVFDTAFHHTIKENVKTYSGPFEWKEMGIEKYGFHGTSFQYCARRANEILGKQIEKMVICHLGSGASLCALENGKSVDTTMGFTPLEGLMMDTRSGSIDPGILLYLLKKKGKTAEDLSIDLYEKSGLLGLSGISSDMRDVLEKAQLGDVKGQLAIDVYLHRLISMIGSMIASLNGIDTLVFTAGIGENSTYIRKHVCEGLSFLGIDLLENDFSKDHIISSEKSKVSVLVIHTEEAFEMAREGWNLCLS